MRSLRPGIAELDREARFLELALHGALVGDVEVADELLRDRRAALHDLTRLHVGPDGAGDPLRIDAAVLVEAPVLDRDRCFRHPRADPRRARRPAGCAPRESLRAAIRRLHRRTSSGRFAPRAEPRDRTTTRSCRRRRRRRPRRPWRRPPARARARAADASGGAVLGDGGEAGVAAPACPAAVRGGAGSWVRW